MARKLLPMTCTSFTSLPSVAAANASFIVSTSAKTALTAERQAHKQPFIEILKSKEKVNGGTLWARDVGAEEYDVLAFDAVRSVLSYLERGEFYDRKGNM
jgi:hypothetical protein